MLGDKELAAVQRLVLDQHHAAAIYHRKTEFQAKDGFGGEGMSVPFTEYLLAKAKYGENCWYDPEFRKAWARDNPESVWKASRGTRGQEYAGTRFLRKEPLPKGTLFVPPHVAAERASEK